MIKTKEVAKSFGGFYALDGLNLNVPKGCVYGLVGPNGAGKTTIIKHLTGVYKQDKGEILIDGEIVYENPALKQKIQYISDDVFYFNTFSLKETADFYRSIYKNFDDERYEKLKEIFKIDEKRRVNSLSKGMKKQVAFMMALSSKPKVLILDEPLDGLDPVMRRNVIKLINQDVYDREMTVLISSHNLRELEDLCDRIGIMHKGKMVLERALDDLKSNIFKIQVAFGEDIDDELSAIPEVMNLSKLGSVRTLIVRGETDAISEKIMAYNPKIFDIVNLTLEEIFIYELGGMGYELAEQIL